MKQTQQNYINRLNARKQELKNWNCSIDDITPLYSYFIQCTYEDRFNYIWRKHLRPEIDKQYQKRVKKDDFTRVLFSKIIFNNLYSIKNYKDDAVYSCWNKDSDIYKFYASHQAVRRELEHLSTDDIIVLSWELSKTFKVRKSSK